MIIAFLSIILIASIFVLVSGKLLYGVIALSGISLISALLFYLLRAPDVAITEAAVGAGVSTVIFVWALRSTGNSTSTEPKIAADQPEEDAPESGEGKSDESRQ